MTEQIFTNCTVGGPVFVHVNDGRIVRVRPFRLAETDPEGWKIEVNGKTYSPPRKITLRPVYPCRKEPGLSEDRVSYPGRGLTSPGRGSSS